MKRLAGVVFAVASLAVAPAAADSERAATLFDEARAAFAQKDFATAARRFEDANREAPRGQTVYNAALSWEPASEPARAADDYAQALEDPALPQAARTNAKERLTVLERQLLTLRIDAAKSATATVGHVENRRLPATVHLPRGHHELVVHFDDGGEVRQEIEAGAGDRFAMRVNAPASPQAVVQLPTMVTKPPPAPNHEQRSHTLAWVAFGASAASIGAAVVLGSLGLGARDDFESSERRDADARSDAIAFRTYANVAWTSAIAFGIAGVVLYFAAPKKTMVAGW